MRHRADPERPTRTQRAFAAALNRLLGMAFVFALCLSGARLAAVDVVMPAPAPNHSPSPLARCAGTWLPLPLVASGRWC